MLEVLNIIYTYLSSLFLVDFSNYSGRLPAGFIEIYNYFGSFFKLVVIFYFVYLCLNFIVFLVSLGGRKRASN